MYHNIAGLPFSKVDFDHHHFINFRIIIIVLEAEATFMLEDLLLCQGIITRHVSMERRESTRHFSQE